jgi:hypothetical protein
MNKQNLDVYEKEAEKKASVRQKKRKPKMKVSGSSVKKLQRILIDKE